MEKQVYELGKLVVEMIEKKKVLKVQALDVHELTPLADVFIIVVANNIKQTQALADDIEYLLKEQNQELEIQKEGYHTASWILLDCGNMIIHILEQEYATFYGLERLWKDAPVISYPLEQVY